MAWTIHAECDAMSLALLLGERAEDGEGAVGKARPLTQQSPLIRHVPRSELEPRGISGSKQML